MMSDQVSLVSVARQLAADPGIASDAERCALFRTSFRWTGDLDEPALAPYCAGQGEPSPAP